MIMPMFVCNVVDLCDIWHKLYIYMMIPLKCMSSRQKKRVAFRSLYGAELLRCSFVGMSRVE